MAATKTPTTPNAMIAELRKLSDLHHALGDSPAPAVLAMLRLRAARKLAELARTLGAYPWRDLELGYADAEELRAWLARPWTAADAVALAAAEAAVPDHAELAAAADAAVAAGRGAEFARELRVAALVASLVAELAARRPGLFAEFSSLDAVENAVRLGFYAEGVELVVESFKWRCPESRAVALVRYAAGRFAADARGHTVDGLTSAILNVLDHAAPVTLDNVGIVFGPVSDEPEVIGYRAALVAESLAYSESEDRAIKAERGAGASAALEAAPAAGRDEYLKEYRAMLSTLNSDLEELRNAGTPEPELADLLKSIGELEGMIAGLAEIFA